MKSFPLYALILCLLPSISFAGGDKKPLIKTAPVPGLESRATAPTYLSIKTMANPQLIYSRNNSDLSITVTGVAQTQNESGLDGLLGDTNVQDLADGGVEIDVRTQGIYSCNIVTFNSRVHSVSGECLLSVRVNLKANEEFPIYVNGNLMRLN